MDGYTEILCAHRVLLGHLFELYSEAKEYTRLQYYRIFSAVLDCLLQLQGVYLDYFSEFADRRYVLAHAKKEYPGFYDFTEARMQYTTHYVSSLF